MAIFDSLFGKKPAPKKSSIASRVEERLKNPPPMENVLKFAPGVLTGDAAFSTFQFEKGVVYCNFSSSGKTAIGYYQPHESNPDRFDVLSVQDRMLIGEVDRCRILSLSRQGQYQRGKRTKFPNTLTYSLEFFGDRYGEIFEIDTREVVCTFSGDPIGAAAAFICASFEVHSYTKYSEFYNIF